MKFRTRIPGKNPLRHMLCALAVAAACLGAAPAQAEKPAKNFSGDRPRELYAHLNLSKPMYYACHTAKDCAVVDMPCGAKVVVSKIFHKNIQGWYNFVAPRYKCAPWLKPQEAKNITCAKNLCRADIVPYVPPVDNSPAGRDPFYCDTPGDCRAVTKSCGEKMTVNKKYAEKLQKQYDDLKPVSHCFHIDGRTVEKITCVRHKCGAKLKIPLELGDRLHPDNPLEVRKLTDPNVQMAQPPGITPPAARSLTPAENSELKGKTP